VTHAQFLDLTLREVDELLEAEAWRRRQDQSSYVAAAWHFALFNVLAKNGKLEPLEAYLAGEDGKDEEVELSPKQAEMLLLLMGATPVPAEQVN
jgi:hypothetical protein